ncbi:MAG: GNAT family N-acetyltransferase [Pseudomonadota bacterium]
MSEYCGDDQSVALQQSIRSRIPAISDHPILANGGRILNILDPDLYGWDRVKATAERDGVVALSMVDRDVTRERLDAEYGPDHGFPCWGAFTGEPEDVVPICEALLSQLTLPDGWHFSHATCPDDDLIQASQTLNIETGVMPSPAYYLRGEHVPSLLTCLHTETGDLVACASATMRYHPDGPLSQWIFAGGVSVDPDYRRRGLGVAVNAALLVESHQRFGWRGVLEQAQADNHASVGMITRCGLKQDAEKVTFAINTTGRYFTR